MNQRVIQPFPTNPTIPQFLAFHIRRSGLTQREVAQACGFLRPNIVSMIKTGGVRLPLERLGAMARVLDVDPAALFVVWMATYYGDTWRELSPLLSWPALSAGPAEVSQAIRS
jgi:transcriptional regulator with XRE-family HTH domain